jgi:DNA-binding XRE family transcriptional regulator
VPDRVTPMRKARRMKGWPLHFAASQVGVARETYRRWEQGTQRCPCPMRVAEMLGITREQVLSGGAPWVR